MVKGNALFPRAGILARWCVPLSRLCPGPKSVSQSAPLIIMLFGFGQPGEVGTAWVRGYVFGEGLGEMDEPVPGVYCPMRPQAGRLLGLPLSQKDLSHPRIDLDSLYWTHKV